MNLYFIRELAWAAGFFDGEGSSGCYGTGCGFNNLRLKAISSKTGVRKLYQLLSPYLSSIKKAQFEKAFIKYKNHAERKVG